MIRALFFWILFTCSFASIAQNERVTKQQLQGDWSCFSVHQADSCMPPEEYVPPLPQDNKWVIKGDSVSIYAYPGTYLGKFDYRISGDSLFISKEFHVERAFWRKEFYATVRFVSDTLVLSMHQCITMKFRRDTFTGETRRLIDVLNKDTLNPYLLVGKYTMITHFVPDDAEAYDQFPPVKMRTTIAIIDTIAARRLIHRKTIILSANGSLVEFHLQDIKWHGYYGWEPEGITPKYHCQPEFIITPGTWWNGESFRVHYQMKE